MRDKFGLEFRIVDSRLLSELRRERGIHVNPWTHFPRLITPIDFLKRERPLRLMSEALSAEGESLYPRKFDLLMLDEAHDVAPSGRGKYAADSLHTLALRRLVSHFGKWTHSDPTQHTGAPATSDALILGYEWSTQFAQHIAYLDTRENPHLQSLLLEHGSSWSTEPFPCDLSAGKISSSVRGPG